jgi:hypothetical protein
MVAILFSTAAAAYGYLSDVRRQSDSLLWDVTVQPREPGYAVVVPEQTWLVQALLRSVVSRHGGSLEAEPRGHGRAWMGDGAAPRDGGTGPR